jgi:hypothetical protein
MFLLRRLFNRRKREEPTTIPVDLPENERPKWPRQIPIGPIWSVVANIRKEIPYGPGGKETRNGTRKFHGCAKVYVVDAYWGMGGENVTVIGHYRGKQYITCVVRTLYLENLRVELVYSPAVINRIVKKRGDLALDDSEKSKEKAEKFAENLRGVQKWLMEEKAQKRADQNLSG